MASTDIDGKPLLILSQWEAKALRAYFQNDKNFFPRERPTLANILRKVEEVCSDSDQLS